MSSHWTAEDLASFQINRLRRDIDKLKSIQNACAHETEIKLWKGEVAPFAAPCKHCGAQVEVKR